MQRRVRTVWFRRLPAESIASLQPSARQPSQIRDPLSLHSAHPIAPPPIRQRFAPHASRLPERQFPLRVRIAWFRHLRAESIASLQPSARQPSQIRDALSLHSAHPIAPPPIRQRFAPHASRLPERQFPLRVRIAWFRHLRAESIASLQPSARQPSQIRDALSLHSAHPIAPPPIRQRFAPHASRLGERQFLRHVRSVRFRRLPAESIASLQPSAQQPSQIRDALSLHSAHPIAPSSIRRRFAPHASRLGERQFQRRVRIAWFRRLRAESIASLPRRAHHASRPRGWRSAYL